ncbi:MAG TPA: hypothetical protein VGR22_08110 [Thermomicrobiales bacterium]|nr:hypothetical protein [Thermomicrobiales bacterium]
MSSTDSPEQPQSRLDRELNEILEQSRNRPISFHDHVARKRNAMEARRHSAAHRLCQLKSGPVRVVGHWALRIPLVTALVLALIAVWLAPEYQFAASLLALGAAAMIFVPFFLRRPDTDSMHQNRWRGRIISSSPPVGRGRGARSWLDSARDRFGR